ncbi:MAG: ParB/RepB/Spo0J family partition protein, partial [Eubacteriales bacterium]
MAKTLARPKIATSLLGDNDGEKVVSLKLYQLFSFENHPFKVLEDHSLAELTESIKEHGVTTPIIVRPKDRGEYEIISGHRRVKASQLLELETIFAFVRDLDDDEAIFQMVDTNIHREMLLPSEKAFAYKMKLEALNRRGKRTDLTYSQVG